MVKPKKALFKLTKTDKKIIDYLVSLKGQELNVKRMTKDINISRAAFYLRLRELKNHEMLFPYWKINTFKFGFTIMQAEARIARGNEKGILAKLNRMPVVYSVRRTLNHKLLIEVFIKEIFDYHAAVEQLRKIGLEVDNSIMVVDDLIN